MRYTTGLPTSLPRSVPNGRGFFAASSVGGLGWEVTLLTPVDVTVSGEPDVDRWLSSGALTQGDELPPLLLSPAHADAVDNFATLVRDDDDDGGAALGGDDGGGSSDSGSKQEQQLVLTSTPCWRTTWGRAIRKHDWRAIGQVLGLQEGA